MRGQKKYIFILITYLSMTAVIVVLILFFIRQPSDKLDINPSLPLVTAYSIQAVVKQVDGVANILVVDYADEGGVLVGFLPTAEIFSAQDELIDLSEIQVGQTVEIKIKFIGTKSVLASQVKVLPGGL